jgi:hypothetical protein
MVTRTKFSSVDGAGSPSSAHGCTPTPRGQAGSNPAPRSRRLTADTIPAPMLTDAEVNAEWAAKREEQER